ncbi:MAG: hypothetical protein H6728_07525 [Myxococcales bacterium]|nr:hypothetical protein [Myxococcales bacterium]MCB9642911.1 hypothetical protein [Myxococcales bacterium]
MKIRGGGAGYPIQRTEQTEKSNKSSKTKKRGGVGQAEQTDAVSQVGALGPVEANDPVFDAVSQASKGLDFNDEASLEEATRAVVGAILREHFGKKNLPEKELEQITQAVTNSVNNDSTMRERLENVLKRIAVSDRKK